MQMPIQFVKEQILERKNQEKNLCKIVTKYVLKKNQSRFN